MKYLLTLIFFFGSNIWAQTQVENKVADVPAKYSKAMIFTEINLLGLKWEELGISNPDKFPNALLNSWIKWFAGHKSPEIQEFVICENLCAKEFSKWQQFSAEEAIKASGNQSRNIWISISYNLKRKIYLPEIKEWQFEWDGRVVMLDQTTKKVLFSYVIEEQRKTWIGLDQRTLNSALATVLYRAPLDSFQQIIKKAPEFLKLTRANRLVVSGYQNLDDVLALIKLLKKFAGQAHFEAQLELFSQKEAQILCFYQAEEKSFTDLLSRLKELKSSNTFRIEKGNNGVLPVLKLIAE